MWGKLDDKLHSHRKTRKAGLEAMGLWVAGFSFACDQLTDGFVPQWFVDSWPNAQAAADRLVSVGLWERAEQEGDPGFQMHDYADHNPTKSQYEARRAADAERLRKWRESQKGDKNVVDMSEKKRRSPSSRNAG